MTSNNTGSRRPQPWEELFADSLRRLREQKGLSQMDLAEALSKRGFTFSQSRIARMERNAGGLRLNEARTVAGFFGVTLDWMIGDSTRAADTVEDREHVLRLAAASAAEYAKSVQSAHPRIAHQLRKVESQRLWLDSAAADGVPEVAIAGDLPSAASAIEELLRSLQERASAHSADLQREISQCSQRAPLTTAWFSL